jgi:zinc-ribbon domain
MFCPNCGKQLLLPGQKFCAYCAGDLSILGEGVQPASSQSVSASSPVSASPLFDAAGHYRAPASHPASPSLPINQQSPMSPSSFVPGTLAPWLSSSVSGTSGTNEGEFRKPTEGNSFAIAEFGMAIVAICAFALPMASISLGYEGPSSSGPVSVSILDMIQRTAWTASPEMILMVGGGLGAAAAAIRRVAKPTSLSAVAPMAGFIALAAGYSWAFLDLSGGQVASLAGYYSYLGFNLDIQPGIGLLAGLFAAAVGGFVCLYEVVQSGPMLAADMSSGTASKRAIECPHCGAAVPPGQAACPSCNGHID